MLRNRNKKSAPLDVIPETKTLRNKKRDKKNFDLRVILILFTLICALLYACYYFFNFYQRYILVKPINLPSASIEYGSKEASQLFWGSYRPNLYFGLKSRSEKSILFGIMWYTHLSNGNIQPLRHWCEQNDKLIRYGWLYHDGKKFGEHETIDYGYGIISSFVNYPEENGGWSVKINVQSLPQTQFNETVGLIAYLYQEHSDPQYAFNLNPSDTSSRYVEGLDPHTKSRYRFDFTVLDSTPQPSQLLYASHVQDGARALTNHVYDNLVVLGGDGGGTSFPIITLPEKSIASKNGGGSYNFAAFNVVPNKLPIRLDVTYRPDTTRPGPAHSISRHDTALSAAKREFDRHFDASLGPARLNHENDNYTREDWVISRSALSNLVGSIGFFSGHSLVAKAGTAMPKPETGKKSKGADQIYPYFSTNLYTGVPSRSFFPRGFLWDEGFHQLVVANWDPDISAQVLGSWFDSMNANGWIPREQILGPEARAKVPTEFVVQRDDNANPPALFLPLDVLWNLYEKRGTNQDLGYLNHDFWVKIFPRAVTWYDWFNRTQTGLVAGTYRWRGRDASAVSRGELNPKTLTSGLDDYPRPTHPSAQERHVDLRCWMAMGARVLAKIAEHLRNFNALDSHDAALKSKISSVLKTYDSGSRLAQAAAYLSDYNELVRLHWSDPDSAFADYGIHTRSHVELRKVPNEPNNPGGAGYRIMRYEPARPALGFVGRECYGYVSLFPFLALLLPFDSPALARLLRHDLREETLLWSSYGLRSLARSSASYYRTPNTEHDPPYWRGDVWININYLALRALKHYASLTPEKREGEAGGDALPLHLVAAELYGQLRSNLVRNILRQYKRTGYLWEHYDDRDGRGLGSHPFTGWTALVTLIMAEIY